MQSGKVCRHNHGWFLLGFDSCFSYPKSKREQSRTYFLLLVFYYLFLLVTLAKNNDFIALFAIVLQQLSLD